MPDKPLKILIVDDEEKIIEYMKKIYDGKGYTTFIASDGPTAVDIFKNERPNINVIDIHMPYSPFDGVETIRKIKAIDKDALCIVISRVTEQDKVDASREAGAYAYLLKPISSEDIDKVIVKAREDFNF